MGEIEERITKIETELEHIKEDNKDTKAEIKTINTIIQVKLINFTS